MTEMKILLEKSAARHKHLCPRQVLGVRIGLLAGKLLELDLPQQKKRLLTIVETDGCFLDGVAVATGCRVGKRTLRVEDFGKVAATFVDTSTQQAVRIAPSREVRELARKYAPDAKNRWHTQLFGYQRMPIEVLLSWQSVQLITSLKEIIGRPGARTTCDICEEEVINEREVQIKEMTYCRACIGESYYALKQQEQMSNRRKQNCITKEERIVQTVV